jgi:hypothetical protein
MDHFDKMTQLSLARLAETIANAGFGENMDEPLGIRLDLLAQTWNVDAQILHIRVAAPKDLARMRHRETQNVKFARRKFDFIAPRGDDSAHEIDAEIASVKHWLFAFLLQPMPLRHADTREELINTERLQYRKASCHRRRRQDGAAQAAAYGEADFRTAADRARLPWLYSRKGLRAAGAHQVARGLRAARPSAGSRSGRFRRMHRRHRRRADEATCLLFGPAAFGRLFRQGVSGRDDGSLFQRPCLG